MENFNGYCSYYFKNNDTRFKYLDKCNLCSEFKWDHNLKDITSLTLSDIIKDKLSYIFNSHDNLEKLINDYKELRWNIYDYFTPNLDAKLYCGNSSSTILLISFLTYKICYLTEDKILSDKYLLASFLSNVYNSYNRDPYISEILNDNVRDKPIRLSLKKLINLIPHHLNVNNSKTKVNHYEYLKNIYLCIIACIIYVLLLRNLTGLEKRSQITEDIFNKVYKNFKENF